MWMWGLETLLVNAFVLYRETHQLVWKTQKKKMFTHFQFCKAVALSWLTGKKASSELNQLMNVWKRSTNSVLTFTNSLSTGPVKKRHVLSMKPPLILKRVHWEDDWVITMSTSLSHQLLSSHVVCYDALLLRTKMWGPTFVSFSVIFPKSTLASRASSSFTQFHLWKTWSLKFYLASKSR